MQTDSYVTQTARMSVWMVWCRNNTQLCHAIYRLLREVVVATDSYAHTDCAYECVYGVVSK